LADPNIWAFARIVRYLVILFLGGDIFFKCLLHMVRIAKLNMAIKAFKKRDNIIILFFFIIMGIDASDMIDDVMLECRKCKACKLGHSAIYKIRVSCRSFYCTIDPRCIVSRHML
jgi:hypothetical protein